MHKKEEQYSVLLDTSFVIRLLKPDDPLHNNAVEHLEYFINHNITMKLSVISIAEYCVAGNFTDIPFDLVQVIPFNINHAHCAGMFAKTLFNARRVGIYTVDHRNIIPNDTKLFAQAHLDGDIKYFVTFDAKSSESVSHISSEHLLAFEHFDARRTVQECYGLLI